MSDEKIVEGVGRGKLRLPSSDNVERAGVAIITRVKLEKYNEKGELYETIVEESDGTTYITKEKDGDH